ncbi:TerC family protein [Tenacibaculum tangerinum]|uniref:TerC family protein n=1 Tax=Tenacibaculum tangerinum TaxID=3038772 RepID=A0ABY8L7I0_9FLAO|nr:TerC family protein [Tenacibaculum tangerinum]WGH76185.1 TerC family protein [Tenacibaculum tangerinum]
MEIFLQADTWVALLTLTFLEVVLGIDNIIFISIASNKLPEHQQKKATRIGLLLAMVFRILLLLGVSYLIGMKDPIWNIELSWISAGITGQSLILIAGGIFLLYKSTSEIHHKVEGREEAASSDTPKKSSTMLNVITQIVLIDIVFSFDSVLTAVGMTNGIEGALTIMIIAVIVSILIMLAFATPISNFVNKHPTIQMLALSFLILIGFMLVTEGAHLSHTVIFGQSVGAIPKGYLYFAIAFSLGVEMLNMKIRGSGNSGKKS